MDSFASSRILVALLLLFLSGVSSAQVTRTAKPAPAKPRARELGITFGGTSGPLNAITDVPGVAVGHTTLVSGEGKLSVGKGPVRTGVTAVFPRGRDQVAEPVFAATYALNGNGEMTGTTWVNESGLLSGPVMLTNTNSVGVVRDAVVAWGARRNLAWELALPVVAETYDGILNDINGFHVKQEHATRALEEARGGPVPEGNVGGGTGMICHGFKGGIGTASRKLPEALGGYTLGVLVQCNYGSRRLFSVEGVPVGEEIRDLQSCYTGSETPSSPFLRAMRPCAQSASLTTSTIPEGMGSIIVLVATDAPLLPHQLARIARRVPLAIGKMGGLGEDSSGDIFLALSTQPTRPPADSPVARVSSLDNEHLNPLFEATVQATQESILNAMLAADTQTGADGVRVFALPQDRLVQALRKYGRLSAATPARTPAE
ncbi:P1 family peptidase [Vitiosangium sp. GDMCC 1.1324]|uniref:DmpA family aminopeptidase n=1 Tax=Vitiosangium sp. (strain GDMCC 1.1324) TaxID=2138576 RepID=UPI000D35C8F6|nr:P1 family peptidase [Vitiosangium sp. GDMCC 1.1324]PTL78825.1 aminopeptidase [Vitiosangium sp. GDMCC 1.1324]